MESNRTKPAAKKISKFMLPYLFGILIVAQVAASGGNNSNYAVHHPIITDHTLEAKIAAFEKTGVNKKINIDYDVEEVIEYATSLIGTPHVMGGYSPAGLDCSGLVKLVHEKSKVELPRSSHDQARYGTILSSGEELKRGDLVFFHSTYKKSHLVTHSGIYLGDNKFIHTSASRGVIISTLFDDNYYEKHYLFATRLER
ncbi:MAG TPA: C40 family peptidase [Ohtaekwangia sp.]|nr:C40 family peptidase [Ohtaekwangia sp.]